MLWAHKLAVPVSHACMRVLMVLAEHADDDGTRSFPSLDTIAREAQTDRKTVVRCLDRLEADGIIRRQVGGGRTKSTEYRLCLDRSSMPETVASGHSIPSENSGAEPQIASKNSGPETINSGLQPINSGVEPPYSVHTLSITEDSSLRSLRARPTPKPDDAGFEAWWEAYPRKVAKDGARRAFVAAVKRGALFADLIAKVPAVPPPGEMQWVPHPATWLNQGRWQDDPAASAPPALQARAPPPRRETREEECRRKLGVRSIFDLDQPATSTGTVIDHEPDDSLRQLRHPRADLVALAGGRDGRR